MKRNLNNLEKDVLSRMIDHLDDLEGCDGYVSELAFTLFEAENINGSMTYNTYKAEQLVYKSDYLLRGRDEEEIDAITYDEETVALIRREWEEALSE